MSPIEKEGISKRLRMLRNNLGLNQEEMGVTCEVGKFYYGNIERGQDNYSESTIIKIAEKLEINPDWLLYGTGESPFLVMIEGKITGAVKPTVEDKKDLKLKRVPIPEFPLIHINKPVVAMSKEQAEQITRTAAPCPDPIVTIAYDSIKFVATHSSGARIYITIIPPVETFTVNYENVDLAMSLKSIGELIDLLECAKVKVQEVLS